MQAGSIFLAALGLACVMEALPWLIAPEKMREALLQLSEVEPESLRMGGLVVLALGVGLAVLSR